MTAEKRGRGRPRKNPQEESGQKNPDCEPATKGYVKCLCRKISEHRHPQNAFPFLAIGATAISSIVIILELITPATNSFSECEWYSMCTILIVGIIMAIDTIGFISLERTGKPTEYNANIIKRYEPPVCKDKSECED